MRPNKKCSQINRPVRRMPTRTLLIYSCRLALMVLCLTTAAAVTATTVSTASTASTVADSQLQAIKSINDSVVQQALSLIGQTRASAHYPCAECHGIDGNPGMTAKYNKQSPKLAGQSSSYLLRQMLAFKTGQRFTAEMAGILDAYDEAELAIIANYYAQQTVAENRPFSPELDTLKRSIPENQQWLARGKKLFIQGDREQGIIACQLCHGGLSQRSQHISPQLQGQYARYTRMSLHAYKNHTRTTDKHWGSPMQQLTQLLSEQDINALAAYLERPY